MVVTKLTRRLAGLLAAVNCAGWMGIQATANAAPAVQTLYALAGSDDGKTPSSPMVSQNGVFYGTTVAGGRYYRGTVYKLDPATGESTTIYSFTGGSDGGAPQGALVLIGSYLYGTCSVSNNGYGPGTVYRIDLTTGAVKTLYGFTGNGDGGDPIGGLLRFGGALYGTTFGAGNTGYGTIFKVDPGSGQFTTVYAFAGGADGGHPAAALIAERGLLYGTTTGFSVNSGTVFKFDPAANQEAAVYSFTGKADGGNPEAPLLALGGKFYGTALDGGANSFGTVFAIDPANNTETTLYSFSGNSDGQSPYAGLTASGGLLYGVSSANFLYGGAIFSVDPSSGVETTLYTFPSSESLNTPGGNNPQSGMVAVGGMLYGTTSNGGAANAGASFSMSTKPGTPTILHNFAGADLGVFTPGTRAGEYAQPGLLSVDGTLYGTNPYDGGAGLGSVFKFDPGTNQSATLYSFQGGTNGFRPQAKLINAGKFLYGTTFGGSRAAGLGTVFATGLATGTTSTLYSFSGDDGASPMAPLTQYGPVLYGATTGSFSVSDGSLFGINRVTKAAKILQTDNCLFNGLCAYGGFVSAKGLIYGTTFSGGTADAGTIFSINPANGAVTTLYSFTGGNDGAEPLGSLMKFGNLLYGTTSAGGANHFGGVFAFDPATGMATGLYSFFGGDGESPQAGLVSNGSLLYGTAPRGGANGNGTIFSLDPVSGAETTLYSFTGGEDGGSPEAELVNGGGTLYGTTSAGGAYNRGTIFSLSP